MNRCLKSRNSCSGSNLVDMGRDAVCAFPMFSGKTTPKPFVIVGEEAMLNVCGVSMARLPGYSRMPNWPIGCVVNVGTTCDPPPAWTPNPGDGKVRCRPMVTVWDGGPVVVRAREKRVHGEGGQQVSSKDAGMPGGRR